MSKRNTIAFVTDFGTVDPCVGVCEGVMRDIAPSAHVVHLNHNVSPHSIPEAIFNLFISYRYFADGTVFCWVIDPGVGSKRRAVAAKFKTEDGKIGYLVAPDNGIMTPILNHTEVLEAVILDNPKYQLDNPSNTFHGRDIFAPAAGHLANGVDISKLGSSIASKDLVKLDLPMPKYDEGKKSWSSTIIHLDRFGNLVTSLRTSALSGSLSNWSVIINELKINQVSNTFADVSIGEVVAYPGSSGFIEIAIRNGNASEILGVKRDTSLSFVKN